MSANVKQYGQILGHGVMEFLAFFPVLFCVSILLHGGALAYGWIISLVALFAVGVLMRLFLANQKRWHVFLILLPIVLTVGSFISDSVISGILFVVFGITVTYRSLQYTESEAEEVLPNRILWSVSVPMYIVGYIVYVNIDSLAPYREDLSLIGFVFLVAMFFMTNQQHLQKESLTKQKNKGISREMKRVNFVFVVITLVISFAITHFQVVQSALYNGTRSFLQTIIGLIGSGDGEAPINEQPSNANFAPNLPGQEVKEPSALAAFMEKVFYVIAFLLIIVAVLLLFAILFKKGRHFIQKAWALFLRWMKMAGTGQGTHTKSEDYLDEKESLFNWQDWKERSQERMKQAVNKFRRKPKFEELSDQAKVRYLYKTIARHLKKQEKWKPSMTAREVIDQSTLKEQLQDLKRWYEHIRYTNQSLNKPKEQELQRLWNQLQQHKEM
ncbi:hypothetical protein [Gracilibacillus sp. YIM 98692]|uniref:hypothetical protein n=1 Tax=Gracilibacillus sp. YIM 98692 TaxID=2663532 RepID=UPI0013D11273|nr:hypothetical protein [Gracilibacillus sp. YIM 98692]